MTPQSFGQAVLGPIIAEFCLRLWSLAAALAEPDDTALLFCARGGLRLQLAYERFLKAAALPAPTRMSSLMVSRVVALRPALVVGTDAACKALAYEFSKRSLASVALAVSGIAPPQEAGRWDDPYTFDAMMKLLRHPDGEPIATVLADQTCLFRRHLTAALEGRRRAILVDTGLFGTTMQLLSSASTDVAFSCALIARSNYRFEAAEHFERTFGLSVEANRYEPWRPRSVLLRYWHLIESSLEPDLPSVKVFAEEEGGPRSNLEIDGWQARVLPQPGSIFEGILSYIDALPRGAAVTICQDVDDAWRSFYQSVVWPTAAIGEALDVGMRGHDFGLDEGSAARPWKGPWAALRGHSLWREGEIARSGTRLRWPLLAGVEAAHGLRGLARIAGGRRDKAL